MPGVKQARRTIAKNQRAAAKRTYDDLTEKAKGKTLTEKEQAALMDAAKVLGRKSRSRTGGL